MRLNGIAGALAGAATPRNLSPRNLVLYAAQADLNGLVPAVEQQLVPLDSASFMASTVLFC